MVVVLCGGGAVWWWCCVVVVSGAGVVVALLVKKITIMNLIGKISFDKFFPIFDLLRNSMSFKRSNCQPPTYAVTSSESPHELQGAHNNLSHVPSDDQVRIFIALFSYDPSTMSPNPDADEVELTFKEGQVIKVCCPTNRSSSDNTNDNINIISGININIFIVFV